MLINQTERSFDHGGRNNREIETLNSQKGLIPIQLLMMCFLLCITGFSLAQDSTKSQKKIKILPVPAFGYSPETQAYFGAFALYSINLHQDSLTRTSSAATEFNYTLLNQIIIRSEWNYFTKEEKWTSRGQAEYAFYPNLYYGYGGNSDQENETFYSSNRTTIASYVLKRKKRLFYGPSLQLFNHNNVEYLDDKPIRFEELVSSFTLGLGATVIHDLRNSIFTPTSGHYYELSMIPKYNTLSKLYSSVRLDTRKYLTFKERFVTAFRIVHESILGDAPFFDWAIHGSNPSARGYFFGRYRGRNLSALQAEFRTHLFWRIGMALFGGTSQVYENLGGLSSSPWKHNGGLGLRFLVDKTENTYLRLDYAIGIDNNVGFYIGFGESF